MLQSYFNSFADELATGGKDFCTEFMRYENKLKCFEQYHKVKHMASIERSFIIHSERILDDFEILNKNVVWFHIYISVYIFSTYMAKIVMDAVMNHLTSHWWSDRSNLALLNLTSDLICNKKCKNPHFVTPFTFNSEQNKNILQQSEYTGIKKILISIIKLIFQIELWF